MEGIKDRIRALRAELGLNKKEFADNLGVRQNTWWYIEEGERPFPDRYVNLICLTFEVRKEWLVDGEGEMFEQNPPQQSTPVLDNEGTPMSADMVKFIAVYQALTPLNQKAALGFLETTLRVQRKILNNAGQKSRKTE